MTQIVYRIMNAPQNSGDKARAEWVAKLMPGAEKTAQMIGITPEAVIAQAALETGWGRATRGNNIFGVKADKGWAGKVQEISTWEDTNGDAPGGEVYIIDRFREYDSLEDAFADHFRFLEANSRYRSAGVFDRKGDVAYFLALQRAGYATDPAYAAKLMSILRTVQSYTDRMERVVVEAPKGYEVKPDGNIVNPDPASSTIVKDAQRGIDVGKVAAAAGAAAPAVTAFAGMDWRLAAVFGVVLVVLGLIWWIKGRQIKNARLDMARQGIV